ncbi:MAG: SRPBCC family protein [Dehalococcoidia bacterium]
MPNRISVSVPVAAAVEAVWEAILDFESRSQYAPRIQKVRLPDGKPLREGSRIELQIGRRHLTPEVTSIDPATHQLELSFTGPGFRSNHIYAVTGADDGASVTIAAEHGGAIGAFVAFLRPGSIRRDLGVEANAIKEQAEDVRK